MTPTKQPAVIGLFAMILISWGCGTEDDGAEPHDTDNPEDTGAAASNSNTYPSADSDTSDGWISDSGDRETDDAIIRDGLDTETLVLGDLSGETEHAVTKDALIGHWEGQSDTGDRTWLTFHEDGTMETCATYGDGLIAWRVDGNLLLESYLESEKYTEYIKGEPVEIVDIYRNLSVYAIAVVGDTLYRGENLVFVRIDGSGGLLDGTWIRRGISLSHGIWLSRTIDELIDAEERYTIADDRYDYEYPSTHRTTIEGVSESETYADDDSGTVTLDDTLITFDSDSDTSRVAIRLADDVFIAARGLDREELEFALPDTTYTRAD